MRFLGNRIPLRTAAFYTLVATLWIVFCDIILLSVAKHDAILQGLTPLHAILIVGAAALVIYLAFALRDVAARSRFRTQLAREERRAARRQERLDALWRLAVHPSLDYSQQAEAVLAAGAAALGLDLGAIGHVHGEERYVYDFVYPTTDHWERPEHIALSSSMAIYPIQKERTVAWPDLAADPETVGNVQVAVLGLRTYIGTPFEVEGQRYVLGFGSNTCRQEVYAVEDIAYMELLAAFFARLVRQQRQEAQITHLAFHDSLSGLANRARFLDWLTELIPSAARRERQFALLYLDLDRFKEVNDARGHAAGDAVLVEAGRRLAASVRADEILARLGGDEFGILVPSISGPDEAQALARRLRSALRTPFTIEDRKFYLSASVGIAICPTDGNAAETLLDHADAAAYQAKDEGRDRECFYSSEIAAQVLARQNLVADLRRALENGDFVLHYQPQIELRSGAVVGAEALLRWNSPAGIIMPRSFLSAAEDSGLMLSIGSWVLEEGLRQAKLWGRAGRNLRVAINVSARQLEDPSFFQDLRSRLARIGTNPAHVSIEITESVAMNDPALAQSVVQQCKALGMHVALDDFGTHYSSLAYLKRFLTDVIKVDQVFVRGLPGDEHDAAIVRAIITLGENLKRAIIAEGVESETQARWLKAAGCSGAQGMWIAPPMPALDFDRWLSNGSARFAHT